MLRERQRAARKKSRAVSTRDRKGDLLFVIALEATSADGPTQQRVIERFRPRKANLEEARDLRVRSVRLEKRSLADRFEKLVAQRNHVSEQIALQSRTVAASTERADILRSDVKSGIVGDSEFQSRNFYNRTLWQLGQCEQSHLQLDARAAETAGKLELFDTKPGQDINQMDRAGSIAENICRFDECDARRGAGSRGWSSAWRRAATLDEPVSNR